MACNESVAVCYPDHGHEGEQEPHAGDDPVGRGRRRTDRHTCDGNTGWSEAISGSAGASTHEHDRDCEHRERETNRCWSSALVREHHREHGFEGSDEEEVAKYQDQAALEALVLEQIQREASRSVSLAVVVRKPGDEWEEQHRQDREREERGAQTTDLDEQRCHDRAHDKSADLADDQSPEVLTHVVGIEHRRCSTKPREYETARKAERGPAQAPNDDGIGHDHHEQGNGADRDPYRCHLAAETAVGVPSETNLGHEGGEESGRHDDADGHLGESKLGAKFAQHSDDPCNRGTDDPHDDLIGEEISFHDAAIAGCVPRRRMRPAAISANMKSPTTTHVVSSPDC